MDMAIFFSWITFSIVAAIVGKSRKIGGLSAFLLSIFLTPLVGLILAFNSEKITEKETPAAMLDLIYKGNDFAAAGKIDEAIGIYKSALVYSEKSPNTHFKLAKMYSLKEDSENSFKYISKAIEDGFSDFEIINNDSSLNFLRNNSGYAGFASNGYKIPTIQKEDRKPQSRVDELEKLNSLYEKGVLTLEEFENEKKRILLA